METKCFEFYLEFYEIICRYLLWKDILNNLSSFKALDVIPDYPSEIIDGVLLTDDKVICKRIRTFMDRIWKLKDIIETLKQFDHLVKEMKMLPLLSIIKNECDSSDEESGDDNRTVSVASPDSLG